MWWIVGAVACVLVVAAVLAYATAHRLDRLHIRADLAAASLLASFLRRHTVAVAMAEAVRSRDPAAAERLVAAVKEARGRLDQEFLPGAPHHGVELAENRLTQALAAVERHQVPDGVMTEAVDVCDRLEMARRFYNDAVRDTRRLRELAVVRAFRLAGNAPLPEYIELIDPSYN